MLDNLYAVGINNRFTREPRTSHLLAGKRITRYIKGTLSYEVLFLATSSQIGINQVGFSGADYCGDKKYQKKSKYLFNFYYAPISWCLKSN